MRYWFDKLYLGTVSINKESDERLNYLDVIYCHKILCTLGKNNMVFDELNYMFYDYLNEGKPSRMGFGTNYVFGIIDVFSNNLPHYIFRRKTLIRIAEELNKDWPNIKMPTESVKIKRIK